MLTFISSVDQLLSNTDQSLIFLFIGNPVRSFSNSVFVSRMEERQEESPLKSTCSIYTNPNNQHPKLQRQDCPNTQQEPDLYKNSKLSGTALSLNEPCRLILEWLDSCISLIDNDLTSKKKKMGQVL